MKKFVLFLVFMFSISLFANYENDLLNRMKPVEKKADSMFSSAQTTVEMLDALSYVSDEWDT